MVINFLRDFKNYLRLKKLEKNYSRAFFVENKFLYKYLVQYINYKESALISYEKFDISNQGDTNLFIFKTNFFQQLVFLTINIKHIYSSTPGLNQTIFQKSKLYNNKYIYIQHSSIGLINAYNHDAFLNFDVVQVTNKFQLNDLNIINKRYNKKIKVLKSKYSLFNKSFKSVNFDLNILIAPSWNTFFFKNDYHKILFRLLSEKNMRFSIRPHPMSFKKKEVSKLELEAIGYKIDDNDEFDFNNFNTLISDWSGIFIEFSYFLKKKAFLINSPKKILNKYTQKLDDQSIEEFSRHEIGRVYEENSLKEMVENIYSSTDNELLRNKTDIDKFFNKYFY
jgi:hypothetical protein